MRWTLKVDTSGQCLVHDAAHLENWNEIESSKLWYFNHFDSERNGLSISLEERLLVSGFSIPIGLSLLELLHGGSNRSWSQLTAAAGGGIRVCPMDPCRVWNHFPKSNLWLPQNCFFGNLKYPLWIPARPLCSQFWTLPQRRASTPCKRSPFILWVVWTSATENPLFKIEDCDRLCIKVV